MKVLFTLISITIISTSSFTQATIKNFSYTVKGKLKGLSYTNADFKNIAVTESIYLKFYGKNIFVIDNETFFPVKYPNNKGFNFVLGTGKELFDKPISSFNPFFMKKNKLTRDEFIFNYTSGGSFYYNFKTKEKIDFSSTIKSAKRKDEIVLVSNKIGKDGAYGLTTIKGKQILPLKYKHIVIPERGNYTFVITHNLNNEVNLFNIKTQKFGLTQNAFKIIESYKKNNKYEIITFDFKVAKIDSDYKFSYITQFDDSQFKTVKETNHFGIYTYAEKHGVYNLQGQQVVPFKYDNIEVTKDKLFIVQKLNPVSNNYEYGLLDSTGKVLLPVKDEHWFIGDNYNGMYKFRKNKKYGFINKNGKVIVEPKYDKVERFYDGFAKATLNGKDYLIDENGNSTTLNLASAKGNMLVSHTFTRNKRGFSRGRYEGMFVWDKKTGNNLFYIMGYEKDKFVLQSHSTLRIPIQSLKDLIGEGDLRIEVAINKQIKDINADKLEHFAKYTAIAYNTKTGKAKVFKYDVDNGFKYSHDLKPEVINQIKSDGGEIRMAIDALPTGPESGYAHVGLITAWNTNTGNNRSFIEMAPRYNRYAYWKNMSFKVPAHCLNVKGKIMMDISSYLAYGNNVNDEVVYNHFVYNTYSQEVYIHKTTCGDDQFNTRYLPTVSTSIALNKKVDIKKPWNTRHNTEEVYMSFNSLNYQNTVVSPVMLYVNSQTGLGYYGQIKQALPNHYLEPGYKDYDGLRKAIARVKGTSTKNPKVIANLYRINSSTFQHRFVYYNTETGAVEVLEFDAQAKKYKTLVALESNPLFKK